MKPTQQSEVDIVEVCKAALSAAQTELKLAEEKLQYAAAAWTEHHEEHSKAVKKLQRSKQEIDDAIKKVTGLGGTAPADLKSLAAKLEHEIQTAEKIHTESAKRIELEKKKVQLEADSASLKARVASWTEKKEMAEYLASQFEEGSEHGLGISTVPFFKTLEEAKSKYFHQVPIVLHVQPDGCISEVSYWRNCRSKGCITCKLEEQPRHIVQDLPKSLNWLKKSKAFKAMRSEEDRSLIHENGVYLVRVKSNTDNEGDETEEGAKHLQSMVAKWDNSLLTHECSLFRNGFFYVESTNEFYGVWPTSISVAEIKYQTRPTRGGNWERFTVAENEREFDASKLFTDFKEHNSWDNNAIPQELASRRDQAINLFASTSPVFEPRNVRLSMDLIDKEVGMYWKAFISSPWSSEITGPAVIMLKHLCVRGIETPDIWTLEHKGHYGFHVRTRDHSWITGNIYCPPAALGRTTPIEDEIRYLPAEDSYSTGRIVKVGEAAIYVSGFKKDER